MRRFLLTALLLTSVPALAADLAGVTMADSSSVAGNALLLNGMGLREKYFIDIYVAGLYLPAKTTDPAVALDPTTAKRLAFEFIIDISKEQLNDNLVASLRSSPASEHADTIAGWMEDIPKGGKLSMDYAPGVGTTISVKGVEKGTIPGTEAMQALFGIYLNDPPVTEALKEGLLGL